MVYRILDLHPEQFPNDYLDIQTLCCENIERSSISHSWAGHLQRIVGGKNAS